MFFDDFFDDFGDLEDFAIVGGFAGFVEEEFREEAKERRRLEKEMDEAASQIIDDEEDLIP